jgi:hypothetical protein
VDNPVTKRLFPGFLKSSSLLSLERLLSLDLDLPRLLGGDLEVLRLLGGGDFEALLFGEGDLEALRLTGGGDFEVPLLFAGGVMDRAVYLTSFVCDILILKSQMKNQLKKSLVVIYMHGYLDRRDRRRW